MDRSSVERQTANDRRQKTSGRVRRENSYVRLDCRLLVFRNHCDEAGSDVIEGWRVIINVQIGRRSEVALAGENVRRR